MRTFATSPPITLLPRAPKNGSPVPWLTSLHSSPERGPYGSAAYPGNCGGGLIKDLLRYFQPKRVLDPMSGSGTCRDVCKELCIPCESFDLKTGTDFADPDWIPRTHMFDFIWIHPPYWRQKVYSDNPRDLSTAATLEEFLNRYRVVIDNCNFSLVPGGKLAILMGDYFDRAAGFVPLVYHTKRLCFETGLRQHCTDIIRFSHGASSNGKIYRSSFIPGLHDVCMIFEKRSSPTSLPHHMYEQRKTERLLHHVQMRNRRDRQRQRVWRRRMQQLRVRMLQVAARPAGRLLSGPGRNRAMGSSDGRQ